MNPGVGVRLADATPWVFADVLVPGLALFLLTRIWVMVAPGFGRRVGRWALLVGLPLLLVLSVVGHVAAPERAHELSDGVDFTAFFLCFPLTIVWLVGLLYRVARRLLGRGAAHRAQERTRAGDWLRLGGVTVPVLGLVGLIQWQTSNDEVKATDQRAGELQTTIRALQATELKAAEFAREREALAERIELMHSIVPRAPELAALVPRLEAQAREYRIQLLEWSSAPGEEQDVLQEHQLTLTLGGDLTRLRDLIERSQKLARLLTWQRVSVRAGKATALLTAYSAPDGPAAPASGDSCVHPASRVWLWPYTAKLLVARAAIDDLCAERAQHATTRAQVDDYQSKKARLTELISAVERARDGRKVPEIVTETDPPPAEEEPLPAQRT